MRQSVLVQLLVRHIGFETCGAVFTSVLDDTWFNLLDIETTLDVSGDESERSCVHSATSMMTLVYICERWTSTFLLSCLVPLFRRSFLGRSTLRGLPV